MSFEQKVSCRRLRSCTDSRQSMNATNPGRSLFWRDFLRPKAAQFVSELSLSEFPRKNFPPDRVLVRS
jgi:hypothetical protein